MPYYEDFIELFENWCKENSCILYFFGKGDLPEKIVVDKTRIRDIMPLQESYFKYLQDKLGEDSIFGEDLPYCVEFDYYHFYEGYDYVLRGGVYV